MKKESFLLVFTLILFLSIVIAIPTFTTNFPTPSNNTFTTNTSIQLNFSIIEQNLQSLIYNWNGTNQTFYNHTLVLMLNLNNISAFGDNATYSADLTNYSNNATFLNGAIYNISGKYGSALQFDGIDDGATVPDSTSLDFGTGGFSWNLWFNVRTLNSSSSSQIISKRVGSSGNIEVQITQGMIEAYIEGTGQSTLNLATTFNVSTRLNQWIFLTLNRNSTTISFYVNGLHNVSGTSAHNVDNTNSLNIGRDYDGTTPGEFYNGTIDNVMIYNRGLTPQEIYQLYVSSFEKFNTTQWNLYINQSHNATKTLGNGSYTYFIASKNSSGTENTTDVRTLTIDTINPSINITSPINNSNSSIGQLNINFTVSDTNPFSCSYSNDSYSANITLSNCANITTVTWSQGRHNLTVYVNDSAGNTNSSYVSFIIDSLSPIWFNNKTNITSTTSGGIYFNITFNDTNTGQYIFSFYNGSAWNNDSSTNYTSNTEINVNKNISITSGDINWTWYLNDSFGNTNQTSVFGITINPASSSSSSSSSDSSSSSSNEKGSSLSEIKTKDSSIRFKVSINKDKTFIKEIKDNKETGIKEFEIKTKNWLTGDIYISNYNEKPDNCVINYPDKYEFYKALEINHSFSDKNLEEARLRLGVNKGWIYDNNISEIKAVRCYPDYEELKISYVNEDKKEGIYDINSRGFSTWAIIGSLSEEKILETPDEYISPDKEKSDFTLWILIISITIILILLINKHKNIIRENLSIHNKWFDLKWKLDLKFKSHKK